MLSFLKKIFCAAEPAQTPAPYKVEAAPVAVPAKPTKPKAVKKPAAKAPRKPRTPKA